MYGLWGATKGYLPCQAIASSTTAIGRDMIMRTKAIVEATVAGSEVVYGDTDSVFVKFPGDRQAAFTHGATAAAAVTAVFKHPIRLELEKCFDPFLLFTKKRYAGIKFDTVDGPGTFAAKGITVVRRDSCAFVQQVCKRALDMIFHHRDFSGAHDFVLGEAQRLLQGGVSLDDLVLSKGLSKAYKNDRQPHITVADSIERREGALARPRIGDRVPFVYVVSPAAAKGFQRSEDPQHVKRAGLKVDYLYYLDHGLKSPMIDLFSLHLPNSKKMFEKVVLRHGGQSFITSYFKAR